MPQKDSAEKAARDIRRKTRRKFSAEEKILIALEGDENTATAIRSRACELYREIGAPLEAECLEGARLRSLLIR